MKTNCIPFSLALMASWFAITAALTAEEASPIHYQGKVSVDGAAVTGNHDFKFAIVDDGTEHVVRAEAVANLSDGVVTSITVTEGGVGYDADSPPTVSIDDPDGGRPLILGDATVDNGVVVDVPYGDDGFISGYTFTPDVYIGSPSPAPQSYWTNAGDSSDGSMPDEAVTLEVHGGIFSVGLGDSSLNNMAPPPAPEDLPRPAFLRVWFDDGSGFQELTPDQPIGSTPFALNAELAREAYEARVLDSPDEVGFSLSPTEEGGALLTTGGNRALEIGVEGEYSSGDDVIPAGPSIVAGWKGNHLEENDDLEIPLGAVIAGGGSKDRPNRVSDHFATISGGVNNTVGGRSSTVGGGRQNSANRIYATVGGGSRNRATNTYATIGGGSRNRASSLYATVGGGRRNTASGGAATISGGIDNTTSESRSTVGGGGGNTASGFASTVPGGSSNSAAGDYSFAAGRGAKALHDGTFVWSDASDEDFESTDENQVLIRASNGVGINTNTPGSFDLAVDGSAAKPGGGSWSAFSDARLKHSIAPLSGQALERLLSLRGHSFHYTEEATEKHFGLPGEQIGFLAQEVAEVFPEWIGEDEDGYLHVTERGTTALMVEAFREQQEIIDTQTGRIEELEREVSQLREELADEQADTAARLARLEAILLDEKNAELAEATR